MLRNITLIILLLAVLGYSTYAQVDKENQEEDEAKEKIWNLLKGGKITAEEANRMLYEEMQKSLNKKNVPIEFYGKVIDQEGNPVEEAEVNGTLGYYTLDPENYMDFIPVKTKTDKEGRFSFKPKEKGINLTIGSPKKDGYEDSYHAGHKTAKFTKDGYIFEHKTEIPKRPDPNNPEIFQIRKKGEPVMLFTTTSKLSFVKNEKRAYALCFATYGYWYTKDLLENAMEKGKRIDLIVSGKYDNGMYILNFKAVGDDSSGIILSDEKLYSAPVDGYRQEVETSLKEGTTSVQKELYLYVKSGIPSVFSRVDLHVVVYPQGDQLSAEYHTYTNPYGDRNLEGGWHMYSLKEYNDLEAEAKKVLKEGKYPSKIDFKSLEEKAIREYSKSKSAN